jgi:hypothetical protein
MKVYRIQADELFLRKLKIESAKIGKTMKQFIIEAVYEKIKTKK